MCATLQTKKKNQTHKKKVSSKDEWQEQQGEDKQSKVVRIKQAPRVRVG